MADALQGTWVFNDTIGDTGDYVLDVSFTSNNIIFSQITDNNFSLLFDKTEAYNKRVSIGWTDEAYKTINITSKLSEVTDGEMLLTWLQANATKQSSISFKHYYQNSPIGTGTIRFRPYTVTEPLPQFATPANVSADGTTVSWDEVENATSYEVFADNNSIGEKATT